jgi:hypothetical protein
MDPFRNYRQVIPATARHCPVGRCAVCCSQPALVRQEFAGMVRRAWSPAERDILGKAARSGLL